MTSFNRLVRLGEQRLPLSLLGLAATLALVLHVACTRDKTPTRPASPWTQIAWSEPTVVFSAQSGGVWYPRLLELDNGTLLCAYDTNENSEHVEIRISVSRDGGRSWKRGSRVFANPECDCANPHLLQLSDGAVLCAFREVGCAPYRIRVAISRDRGQTWSLLSTVDSSGSGLWEPFLLSPDGRHVHVFYSSEAYQPQYPQVVAARTSIDGGKTWSAPRIVASSPRSRDGMASVVVLPDGQWLCFFEATDAGNPFVIRSVRSLDGGQTWTDRSLVYAPDSLHFASAPYGVLLSDGSLLVTFQTDEERTIESCSVSLDLKYVRSFDGGKTWSESRPVLAGTDTYWWNSVIQLRDGTLLAASSVSATDRPSRIVVVRGELMP
ncbi:MAG: exo-alpha-sialidase [Calditrichaeota bacterium]|nr:exo-alpha-sialidase [Calditrichota bacterium]